ncbi:MAG: 30S ribosomal protein S4 [Actinobacteria bacterium]|nr:30S ribosomal protein S4 [Actinomycetota bacterium]
MARYTGPDCKRCRREKTKLFLKGSKCITNCPLEKHKNYPPGMHGQARRTKESEYLLQMREKQKCARIYGVLEKQFRNYFAEASRLSGKTGDNLLTLLERRLDNTVYRAGFASSRDQARQLVRHGHFTVNGQKVNIPSYRVSPSDIIEVKASSRELTPFLAAINDAGMRETPAWLEPIPTQLRILVHSNPERGAIDTDVAEQLIVELYSK